MTKLKTAAIIPINTSSLARPAPSTLSTGAKMELMEATAHIVTAFVGHNTVSVNDVPTAIARVHAALSNLRSGTPAAEPVAEHVGVVSAKASLRNPDKLISMIDGKPYSSLTRHLGANGMTPDQYRERYNLPTSYPMVAPGYSAKRSAMAKAIGLGLKTAVTA